ncbi:hypothetical protein [Legionella saoudiensis]|uniref:hypothetical protein n=1 Tax=Legionella saoudiensis TaxID=1750561 RepID=UPI00122E5278|nr:hypothetical protein [Legionella saoudiensis]
MQATEPKTLGVYLMRNFKKERKDLLLIWLEKGYITSEEIEAYPENDLFLRLSGEKLGFFLEDRTISLTQILKTENKKLLYFSIFYEQIKRVMAANDLTSNDLFDLSIEKIDQLKQELFPQTVKASSLSNLPLTLFAATPLQKKQQEGFIGFDKEHVLELSENHDDDDIYGDTFKP